MSFRRLAPAVDLSPSYMGVVDRIDHGLMGPPLWVLNCRAIGYRNPHSLLLSYYMDIQAPLSRSSTASTSRHGHGSVYIPVVNVGTE